MAPRNTPKSTLVALGTSICLSSTLPMYSIAGVCEDYRKQGIASLLLENLISHLTSDAFNRVKALYLHVLTTNTQAITFYEHRLGNFNTTSKLGIFHYLFTDLFYFFQRFYSAFLPSVLLRDQGEAKGRVHLRTLLERRPPDLERAGLRPHLRAPRLLSLPPPRALLPLAEVPAGLVGRGAKAPERGAQLHSSLLLTETAGKPVLDKESKVEMFPIRRRNLF